MARGSVVKAMALVFGVAACSAEVGVRARAPGAPVVRHGGAVDALTGWDKLGERWVDGQVDHDVISVGRADGRFRAVKIKVEHGAIEMFDVVVTFGDGSTFSPPTRLSFPKGGATRVVDLPGGQRVIRRVDFRYRNLPGGGRAQVELWGRP